MTRFNKKQHERAYWLSVAGEDVLAVLLFSDFDTNDWRRRALLNAHRLMVWDRAHDENRQIDFDVKHANWLKPPLSEIAGRIVARDRLGAIDLEFQNLRGVAQASAEVPLGGAVSTPSPAPPPSDRGSAP